MATPRGALECFDCLRSRIFANRKVARSMEFRYMFAQRNPGTVVFSLEVAASNMHYLATDKCFHDFVIPSVLFQTIAMWAMTL